MKNLLLIFPISLFFLACGSNDASQPETEEVDTVALYSWEALLNDSTGRMEMKKIEPGGPDTLDAPSMIAFINQLNPNIQMQLVKISGDTLYVAIPEATYLTQQMGSTGPALYFAEAVFNLTEIPGIRFVSFDFEEGDHASPGVLSRERYASASNDL